MIINLSFIDDMDSNCVILLHLLCSIKRRFTLLLLGYEHTPLLGNVLTA